MAEPDPPDDAGAPARDPDQSGSIEVRISDPALTPVKVVPAAGRRQRATTLPAIGAKVVQAADAVSGRVIHAVDVVGETMARAGGKVGESLSHLPVMPKTRRGRVMVRSVVVSFLLVFGWISVIVGLQLRVARPPDLRPEAESILIALRDGKAAEVYRDRASIEFQRVVRDEETFVDLMADMSDTLGKFREITAVVATTTAHGPGGYTARFDVRLAYEKGQTSGSLSFRREAGAWKLLGLGIAVPEAIRAEAVAPTQRAARSSVRPDELAVLRSAVEGVLGRSSRGEIDLLWQEASPIFQQAISVEDLRRTEADRRRALGPFDRILDVKAHLNPGRNRATLVVLLQFEKATITGNFLLDRTGERWRLEIYKLVMPVLQLPADPPR